MSCLELKISHIVTMFESAVINFHQKLSTFNKLTELYMINCLLRENPHMKHKENLNLFPEKNSVFTDEQVYIYDLV